MIARHIYRHLTYALSVFLSLFALTSWAQNYQNIANYTSISASSQTLSGTFGSTSVLTNYTTKFYYGTITGSIAGNTFSQPGPESVYSFVPSVTQSLTLSQSQGSFVAFLMDSARTDKVIALSNGATIIVRSGQRYYISVENSNATGYSVNLTFSNQPFGPIDVSAAIPISCGQKLSGTLAGAPNNITNYLNSTPTKRLYSNGQSYYNYYGWANGGPEKIYTFTLTSRQTITARIYNGINKSLNILSAPDNASVVPNPALDSLYSYINIAPLAYYGNVTLPAGTYYAVVEGGGEPSADPTYSLELTCGAAANPLRCISGAIPVARGQSISGSLAGAQDNLNMYGPTSGRPGDYPYHYEGGVDRLYKLSTPFANNVLQFTSQGFNGIRPLLLADSCSHLPFTQLREYGPQNVTAVAPRGAAFLSVEQGSATANASYQFSYSVICAPPNANDQLNGQKINAFGLNSIGTGNYATSLPYVDNNVYTYIGYGNANPYNGDLQTIYPGRANQPTINLASGYSAVLWIDYNGDGDFDDASEALTTSQGPFTPSLTDAAVRAAFGQYRTLRVRAFPTSSSNVTSCGVIAGSQTVDFYCYVYPGDTRSACAPYTVKVAPSQVVTDRLGTVSNLNFYTDSAIIRTNRAVSPQDQYQPGPDKQYRLAARFPLTRLTLTSQDGGQGGFLLRDSCSGTALIYDTLAQCCNNTDPNPRRIAQLGFGGPQTKIVPQGSYVLSVEQASATASAPYSFSYNAVCVPPSIGATGHFTSFTYIGIEGQQLFGAGGYYTYVPASLQARPGQAFSYDTRYYQSEQASPNVRRRVLLDLNGDGDFDDAGELVGTLNNSVFGGSFTLSASDPAVQAALGKRVTLRFQIIDSPFFPDGICSGLAGGQTVDFPVLIGEEGATGGTPPAIASFSPISGAVGDRIRIRGTGFKMANGVSFGTAAATNIGISGDTLITAIVPAGAATGRITVSNPVGKGVTTQYFTVTGAYARIASITPNPAYIGDTVLIKGKYLTGYRFVNFNGARSGFTRLLSDSTLKAVVPPGSSTGPVLVQGAANQVSYPLTIIAPPQIFSLSAGGGPVGFKLRIHGARFAGVTQVRFGASATGVGGVAASNFAVGQQDSLLSVIVPSGATSGRIVVVNRAGQAVSQAVFNITAAYAVITAVTPGQGRVGDTVRIAGRYFTGARFAVFGAGQAYYFRVYGDSLIKTVVPPRATSGRLLVQGAFNQATSTFTVLSGDGAAARLGLDDAAMLPFAFSLYPNPSKGQATLRVQGTPAADAHLEVYTADGRLIHTQSLSAEVDQQIGYTFSRGLYLLRASGKVQRLVVE